MIAVEKSISSNKYAYEDTQLRTHGSKLVTKISNSIFNFPVSSLSLRMNNYISLSDYNLFLKLVRILVKINNDWYSRFYKNIT